VGDAAATVCLVEGGSSLRSRQLGWLGCEAWWWSLCGDGAVAVQGCAGQWRCWLALVDRVRVVVLLIRAKAWPVLAGRRRRRSWASHSSLEAPSW
jgi:hypothetical protein